MKKILLITLYVLLPNLSFGQEIYRPFLEEGKVWTYHYYNDFTGKEYYESLTVAGDTVIGDKSYKRIVDVATGGFEYAIREEGRKVYLKYPRDEKNKEELFYDFGLNVGDTFQPNWSDEVEDPNEQATVVAVDTVVVGGRAFRVLDVRMNGDNLWANWWVEGIGGMEHLSTNFPMLGNFYCFSSCQLNGETILTYKDICTVGIRNQLLMREKDIYTSLYDVQGRRLSSAPRKGIYIKDGKKVVIK